MSKKSKYSKEVLAAICPTCGAWKGKECKHTGGSKQGKHREEPHPNRVKMSKTKLSDKTKKQLAEDIAPTKKDKDPKAKLTTDQKKIVETLLEKIHALGKGAEFVGPVTIGPYITTYLFKPERRTKVKHLEAMSNDFAVALGVESALCKMMPGSSAVAVFVQNKEKRVIQFSETTENIMQFMDKETEDGHKPIPLNFGMDYNGKLVVDDLTQQPHLLMAGTTGSGKSTEIRAIVLSMLMAMKPSELKMIISDTKGVEFRGFKEIPHLLHQYGYCSDVYSTMAALDWAVKETQRRYESLAQEDVQNIHQFNKKVPDFKKLPYIVILIDELADLISNDMGRSEAKANSDKLKTIAGRSRAAGIHLVAATQRPDVSTVKGSIKTNFPSRLSFRLPSNRDSITILGTKGAEFLMSKGDMLYTSSTNPALRRLHAPWTSIEDVKATIEFIIQRANMDHNDNGRMQ